MTSSERRRSEGEGRQNRARVTSRPGDRRTSRTSGGAARTAGKSPSTQARARARRARIDAVDEVLDDAVVEETADSAGVDSVGVEEEAAPEIMARNASGELHRRTNQLGAAALRTGGGLLSRVRHVDPKRTLLVFVALVFVALTLAVPARNYVAQRSDMNREQAVSDQLHADIEFYERKITEQNDPAYIENQARERLQFGRPGEKVFVLTHPAREQQEAAERQAREYASNPWYENLWDAVSTPPEDK